MEHEKDKEKREKEVEADDLHRVEETSRRNGDLHTLAGRPGDLELGEEPPQLLPDGGGPQQTLVIEEVLVAPLGALLVLPREKHKLHHLNPSNLAATVLPPAGGATFRKAS